MATKKTSVPINSNIIPIILFCLFLSISSYLSAAPAQLQISGTHFVTVSNGCQMRLVGVDVDALEWSPNGYGPPSGANGDMTQSVTAAVNTWKANIVRIPVSQDFWFGYGNSHGTPTSAAAYRTLVDNVVTAASNLNCYVELDLHWSGTGTWGTAAQQDSMPDNNSIAFWQDAATRYANNPAVMFDLYNEPFPTAWSTWKNGGTSNEGFTCPGFQTLVQTVRDKGAKNVIMVGGLGYSWDMTGISSNALTDKNTGNTLTGYGIAYEAHIYDNKGGTTESDKINLWNTNVTVAITAGYCVIISEFGAASGEDNSGCTPFESDLISWINGNNTDSYVYSAMAWDFNTQAAPCLISDWNFTATTCHGAQVKSWLAAVTPPNCGGGSTPTNTPILTRTFTPTFTRTPMPTSTITFTPTPMPAMSLTKTVNKASLTLGDTVTFTLSYQNTGSVAAPNVPLWDTIPGCVSYIGSNPAATQNGSLLSWNLGNINSGSNGSVTWWGVVTCYSYNPLFNKMFYFAYYDKKFFTHIYNYYYDFAWADGPYKKKLQEME